MQILKAITSLVLSTFMCTGLMAGGPAIDLPMVEAPVVAIDTIPIKDNYGDHITDPNRNPFDITPKEVEQKVEYDPKTGNYIIFEKIGDEYYRTPTYLTFEEYMEFKKKEQERNYFSQMAGLSTGKKKKLNLIDPMNRVDIGSSLVDRLFGGTEVNIQPQGNVDITLGFDYQKTDNPTAFITQQTQAGLDFDMKIRMNVDGNIGEKLNLGFNYDTQSTFDFDRKIKLEYDSEAFSEDDIIKKIEAGNVSLPLRGNLIQGAQSLFGLKTELQFGHLRLTAIASQQQSKQNNLKIQSGNEVTELDPIYPDDYDENRHFFISHYNRNTYEKNLRQIPFIATSYRINRIEVWISDDRSDYQTNSRQVCAITDLAEPNLDKQTNMDPLQRWAPTSDSIATPLLYTTVSPKLPLPDNRVNPLYAAINDDANEEIYDIDKTVSTLTTDFNLQQTQDFEVFQGRLLSSSEFTYHPELGTISLNVRLRPNQVLGVAYEYFYTENCDEIYSVGQLSDGQTTNFRADEEEEIEPPKITFLKLLKTSVQKPYTPSWDLMMKNVYSLRTSNLNQEDFEFDIFWQDDSDGSLKKYIDLPGIRNKPLLEMFNLDRLNKFQDPQPDGIYDYVPGITVIERNGTVVFPKLEPFGDVLRDALLAAGISQVIADSLAYTELYDESVTSASNNSLDKNKFTMLAKVKNAVNGDIQLGPFVPQGSVRVTAGGRELVEGSDYEIDYTIGRLRIINEAYLQEGVPINVNFEDNAVFSLQQKNMLGLRAEYDFSEKLSVGATYLRLFERPFTQKVNIGDDPINNRVFGLDLVYSDEAPIVTSIVDKFPFYSTKEKSSINFTGEVAALKPGTSSAINSPDEDQEAVLNIDDFEGAVSGFLLGTSQNNTWTFASTPPVSEPNSLGFAEAELNDNLEYGKNRAKLAWYQLERGGRSTADQTNPYTRQITQQELFERDVPTGDNTLYTFDMSYWPEERGPYNFDTENVEAVEEDGELKLKLKDPENRWAGIMRYFNNPDFEAANYEFIEFWMLNPYHDRPDSAENPDPNERGKIVFHLGNVSEDILKDGRQFYENSLNIDSTINVTPPSTAWGNVPFTIPVVDGFDFEKGASQDVGLDGLNDTEEETKFRDYVTFVNQLGVITSLDNDFSGDNFKYFDDPSFPDETSILERYKDFNNPQGNAPLSRDAASTAAGVVQRRGNPSPEKEDLNNNRSLESGEAFYEFVLDLNNDGTGELEDDAADYIKESRQVTDQNTSQTETWYRVQIPVQDVDGKAHNGISGFRSIQFMRMYMTGFSKPKTFRMAEFELVRNQWRRQEPDGCNQGGIDGPPEGNVEFNVDERGVEENSAKLPFGYEIPPGIQQERIFSTFANVQQDENSLSLNFKEMGQGCEVKINKLTELDMTFYEKLELFVHLEEEMTSSNMEYGDMSVFIRVGKDFDRNYYEYELPLKPSEPGNQKPIDIWPDTNMISIPLEIFTDLKKQRAAANGAFDEPFPKAFGPNLDGQPVARIKGNPSLGFVKMMQIGIRNTSTKEGVFFDGEAWVNELRAKGLKNGGGIAAQARMQLKMADLGEINLAGSYESVGWGALDQRVQERSRDQIVAWDAATNLSLDKFFPESWGVQLPFYGQISKNIATPKYDPYQLDLTVDEAQALEPDEDVKERAQTTTTVKAFNMTNVKLSPSGGGGKKGKGKGGSRKPWSPSNVSVTYAFSETKKTDPIIEEDNIREHTTSLDYQYSRRGGYIQPFKFIKPKSLKLISDFGFNLFPSSLTFSTSLNRQKGFRTFRLPTSPVFRFDDKRFTWERRYGLKWDLTKNLKMNFDARTSSIIDELRQTGIADDPDERDWVDESGADVTQSVRSNPDAPTEYWQENLLRLGRNQGYTHNLALNYTVPFKNIPLMDWVNVKADYKSSYGWDAASLIIIDDFDNGPGNVIRNSQDRSLNATLSFDKLYSKSGYLKQIEKGKKKSRKRKRSNRNRAATKGGGKDLGDGKTEGMEEGKVPGSTKDKKKKKERDGPTMVERILIRPLLMLRQAKLTYKENLSSLIPGLEFQPQYLGLQEGFAAPGWGYAFGIQPNIDKGDANNFLRNAASEGWVNESFVLNSEVNLDERHDITGKFIIEPFNDFKIDLNFKKSYQKRHREVFKNKIIEGEPDPEFIQTALYDMGSFEATYIGLNTLFMDANSVYKTFLSNRVLVSQQLGEPGSVHENEDYVGFAEGLGPNNPDVAVPAFLAAYENKTLDQRADNGGIEQSIKDYTYIPKPNWSLTYDGLNKLGIFKNFISSFSLKHGYRSTIRVNSFNTTARYNNDLGFLEQDINEDNGNYYSRILIPALSITEQFAPLLGISFKTKNDMNIDFEYSKSRNLDLRLTAEELGEDLSTEISFGFGYTIKDFQGFGKKKKRTRKKKDQEADKKDTKDKSNNRRGKVNNSRGRNLTLNFDFSYRDDVSSVYQLSTGGESLPVRGTTTYKLNPNVDYVMNDNLTLRFFADYSKTTPRTTRAFPITTFATGITMRFTLN